MDMTKIRETGKCCCCFLPLKDSKHLNMVPTSYVAQWDYPVMNNVTMPGPNKAVAYICDSCFQKGTSGTSLTIKYVVKFDQEQIIYVPVETLSQEINPTAN